MAAQSLLVGAGRARRHGRTRLIPGSALADLRFAGRIRIDVRGNARGALLCYGPATAKVWATQDERWVYATIAAADAIIE
jgi:hypothetical protein